jgi:8-oxo-dGTP diphosphatase
MTQSSIPMVTARSTQAMTILPADYCPDCGRKLTTRLHEGDPQPYCEVCDRMFWQQPIPCVDIAVVDESHVLLIKRKNTPNADMWALPGGIINSNESPAKAAARELDEETNVTVAPTELCLLEAYSFAAADGWYNVGYVYAVSRAATSGMPTSGTDAQAARFWTLADVLASNHGLRSAPDDASHIRTAMETISDH